MGSKERKQREKEQRRAMILSAATALFLEQGYQGVTLNQLAQQCELAKGTLYLYFRSKSAMLATICKDLHGDLNRRFQEVLTGPQSGGARLNQMGLAYTGWYMDHKAHLPLLAAASHPDVRASIPPELLEELQAEEGMPIVHMTALVEKCMEEGFLKPDVDPQELALILAGTTMGMIILAEDCHTQLPMGSDAYIRKGWQLILDALVAQPDDAQDTPGQQL